MSESNINVVIKMRPLIKRELEKKIPVCWRKNGKYLIDSTRQNEFQFDSIFDEESTTAELYDQVARPIVSNALAGVNGTIFAYGQTSSGKTYTMMGGQGNDGIMMMAIKHIFNEVQSSHQEFVLRVGFIEIYNEKIFDLYDPDNVDLKVMEINNDVSVNCKEVICQSVDDMFNVIKVGNRNKKIGDTDMNDRSSRSHTIFHIVIESIDSVSEKAKISSLNLVDLAGSERASQTNSTGTRFLEGIHINMSLLSLSKVINKLIKNDGGHINYRDSKLTRYLQSSLGGNALAAIICTVCPTALEETISTLYFAQRAMEVTNKPKVNEIISDSTMIKKLHNQIEALKSQLNMERAKNAPNSAVPRLLQELSQHQGNILNYRSLESKHKLRRRTWNTFDNDLDVIPETNPLVLPGRQMLSDRMAPLTTIPPPFLQIVNAGRGTGEMLEDFPERDQMDDAFDYKSKYEKLLFDYEELLEFTNWEKELGIEPVSTSVEEKKYEVKLEETEEIKFVQSMKIDPELEQQYIGQIEELERERQRLEELMAHMRLELDDKYKTQMDLLVKERKEVEKALRTMEQEKQSNDYLYELNQKKAEQREKDLVNMLEEMKNTDLIGNAVREKTLLIAELQEQVRELAAAKDALAAKVDQQVDMERRLEQMGQVEMELMGLRNTITTLSNTILTLENEKKEMSVRFNDSMSASTIECLQSTNIPTATQESQTEDLEPETSKLQADYDEMSSKVMDLIEENEDYKQRIKEMEEKLTEINSDLSKKVEQLDVLTQERDQFELNYETLSEEVALGKSEKDWLERKSKETEQSIEELEGKYRTQLDEKDSELKQVKEQLNHHQQELERAELQKAQDEAKFCELENQILVKVKEIQRGNEQIEELNKEMSFLKEEFEKKSLLVDEIQTKYSHMVNQVESLENNLKQAQDKVSEKDGEFVTEIERLNLDKQSLEINLKQAQDKVTEKDEEFEMKKEEFAATIERLNLEKQETEENLNKLSQELEKAKLKLSQLEEERMKIFESEDEIMKKIKEIQQANDRIEELNKELVSLREEFEEKSTDLIDIQTMYTDSMNTIQSLEIQLAQTQSKAEEKDRASDKEKQEFAAEIDQLNLEKNNQEENSKKLAQELHETKLKLNQLEEERTKVYESESEILTKVKEIQTLNQQIEELNAELKSLKEESENKSSLLAEIQESCRHSTNMVESLETRLKQARDLVTEKDQDMEQAQREFVDEIGRLNLEKQDKEERLNKLVEELEDAKIKLSQFEVERMRVSESEGEIQAKEREIQRGKEKIEELSLELSSLTGEFDKKSSELTEIQTKNNHMATLVESLEIKLKEAQGNSSEAVQKLEKEKDEFKTEIQRLSREKQNQEVNLHQLTQELEVTKTKLSQLEVEKMSVHENKDELQRAHERIEAVTKEYHALKEEAEKKSLELTDTQTQCTHMKHMVESLEIKLKQAHSKDQEYEKTKREFVTEIGRLNLEKQDKEEKIKKLIHQHEDAKDKLSQLEVELARREPVSSASSTREEATKLKEEVKRLRMEINGIQNKERRARRSSTFDTNRDLLLGHCVGTMTDPVSEACQCEVLNQKVVALKKMCNFKDMEMVELRESQKRSPMLLENYGLKKLVEQYKEREVQFSKQIASKKPMLSNQTQTLPDPILEKFQDAQECVRVTKHKYEMAKVEIKNSRKQLQELETQLSQQRAAFEVERKTLTELVEKKADENDSASANQAEFDSQGKKKKTLQEKYNFLKVVMEKRYYMIMSLEEKLAQAVGAMKSCPKCQHKVPVSSSS